MSLLFMVLILPSVAIADVFQRAVGCPTAEGGLQIFPDGGYPSTTTIEINDVIVSANGTVFFELFLKDLTKDFGTSDSYIMQVAIRKNGNFVTNFSGKVHATDDQVVYVKCTPRGFDETPTIYLTIVGTVGVLTDETVHLNLPLID